MVCSQMIGGPLGFAAQRSTAQVVSSVDEFLEIVQMQTHLDRVVVDCRCGQGPPFVSRGYYVYMIIYVYVYVYIYICKYMYIYMWYDNIYSYMHICIYVHMYIYIIHIYIYICNMVYIYMIIWCMYIYTYIYIHIHSIKKFDSPTFPGKKGWLDSDLMWFFCDMNDVHDSLGNSPFEVLRNGIGLLRQGDAAPEQPGSTRKLTSRAEVMVSWSMTSWFQGDSIIKHNIIIYHNIYIYIM